MNNDTGDFEPAPRGALIKQWPMLIDDLGSLMPVELSEIPFDVKRVFTITDCPPGQLRGGHAHKQTQQYLICLKGIIRVLLVDRSGKREIPLRHGHGLLIKKMTWDKLQFMTGNDVLMVFCDTTYSHDDYIENFDVFKKMLSHENNGGHDRPE